MHKRNDTAFDDVASQGTDDTGDTESVATENFVGAIESECTVAPDCSATVAVSQQVDVSGTFQCDACLKTFQTKPALRLHQFRKHQISSVADIKNLKPATGTADVKKTKAGTT